ncbi:MAG: tryptophan synthase subunit alpha [Oscillospiraceae bacterium]|jgi:tryptophan synthase alpha chain|nr:tryptophan synthase subunit alpha [Oscillospiraceae bacterium]
MSKTASAFRNGKAFIGFVTGGDPTIAKSEEFILAMAEAGTDLIEIGIPFSDPIAEGPVIQEANLRALSAGATVEKLFGLVQSVREKIQTPLVFLTYLNPVYHYGYEAFCKRCAEVGLDGLIIPDMPFEEQEELRSIADSFGVDLISLVAPTSEARVTEIAAAARGFLYIVSSMGVTGVRSEITTDLGAICTRAHAVSDVPVAVGFGVHSPAQAAAITAAGADGVIVGSAIVKLCAEYGAGAAPYLADYCRAMKAAIS